jgi:predicted membrane protein (TIGR00267 family)
MSGIVERLKEYAAISNIGEISRRYFVMNAFDGALTMLGVVIGACLANIRSPLTIISAGLAGSLAMGISGVSGAYMAEKAERIKKLKSLERAMMKELRETIHYRSQIFAVFAAAAVDGLSPFLAGICVISPFIAVNFNLLDFNLAFFSSISIALAILLLLGIYLAKISDESMILYGVQMIVIGGITVLLCVLISIALGGGLA